MQHAPTRSCGLALASRQPCGLPLRNLPLPPLLAVVRHAPEAGLEDGRVVGMGEAVDDVEVAFVVLEGVPQVTMVEASIPDKLVYLRVVLDVAIGRVDGNLVRPPNVNHEGLKLALAVDHPCYSRLV